MDEGVKFRFSVGVTGAMMGWTHMFRGSWTLGAASRSPDVEVTREETPGAEVTEQSWPNTTQVFTSHESLRNILLNDSLLTLKS